MANLLSMYNTQEKDFARDLRDLLAGLNIGGNNSIIAELRKQMKSKRNSTI